MQIKDPSLSQVMKVWKKETNKQVVSAVSVSFIIFLIVSIVLISELIINFSNLSTSDIVQFIFAVVLFSVFTIYLGYVMRKIYKNRFK